MPNRIAIYLTALAGICTAIAPAVANLDTSSTVGLATGFAGIAAIAFKFLEGWQRYEERTDLEGLVAEQLGADPEHDPAKSKPADMQ